MVSTNYISKFIKSNASSTIISRGKQIYKSESWAWVSVNKDDKIIKIEIESSLRSQEYKVIISDYDKQTISTSCTCPYDWGPICKHEVAALMLLKEELDNGRLDEEEVEEQPKVIQTNGSAINTSGSNLTTVKLSKISNLVNYANTNAKTVSKGETFLKFGYVENLQIQDLKATAIVYDGVKKQDVSFERQGHSELSTNCTCKNSALKLCEHKIAALLYIRKFKGEYLFEQLRDYSIEKAKLLEEYGFKMDDPWEEKFQFFFRGGKLDLKVLDSNILKISKPSYWNNLAKSINQPTSNFRVNINLEEEEISEWENGYAFAFDEDIEVPGINIIQLMGKANLDGNRFKSNLQSLADWEQGSEALILDEESLKINSLIRALGKRKIAEHLGVNSMSLYYKNVNDPSFQKVQNYVIGVLRELFPYLQNKITGVLNNKNAVRIGNFSHFHLSDEILEPHFSLQEENGFLNLEIQLKLQDQILPLAHFEKHGFLFWAYDDELFLMDSVKTAILLKAFKSKPQIRIHKNQFFNFYQTLLQPIMRDYPIDIQVIFDIEEKNLEATRRIYISEDDNLLIFTPKMAYDNHEVWVYGQEEIMLDAGNNKFIRINRDSDAEHEFGKLIEDLHPSFARQRNHGQFHINIQDLMRHNWFFNTFEFLREEGIEIYGFEDLKRFKYNSHRPEFNIVASSGIDWFDVKMKVQFGEQVVDLKAIQKAITRNENFVRLGDGSLGLLPEDWIEKNALIFKMGTVDKDVLKISKIHFSLIDTLFDGVENDEYAIQKEIYEKKRKLVNFSHINEYEKPPQVQAELRDYQTSGFNWMCFLNEFGWGGCLADDMGLGKTVQVLTFLQHLVNENPEKTHLVIVPTSLIFNWVNEIKKFCPELTYLIHRGTDRNKNTAIFHDYNIVLTTYGILVRDIEILSEFKFNYVVLDESQAIKNPNSKRYKAVRLLNSYNRLVLTGTPVENNTYDLFAQMNFLNPGLLGSMRFFKEEFAKPIDREKDKAKVSQLKKMIFPFLLRRTKQQVAKELPEKTESILLCEMGKNQRKVYEAYKQMYRDKILKKVDTVGLNKSRFFVLEGLMKLRQICDSPALINNPNQAFEEDSVKIDLLVEHILEKTGEHKILVFSQFVKMLKLIRQHLEKLEINFEYLDGSTAPKDRQKGVERFQNDNNCRVFLISLKAGGFGLNLTEADYVYLVDPWWNPAVEMQAVDRTHRIGQTRKVFAYKLICKDTIEEKVLQLQQRKKNLVTDLISEEGSFYKSLEREDIEALFS